MREANDQEQHEVAPYRQGFGLTNLSTAVNDTVWSDNGSLADRNMFADDTESLNFGCLGNFGVWVNDGIFVYVHGKFGPGVRKLMTRKGKNSTPVN